MVPHRGEGLRRAGARLLLVGAGDRDGVPSEGVVETYTGQRSTGYSASSTAKGASASG